MATYSDDGSRKDTALFSETRRAEKNDDQAGVQKRRRLDAEAHRADRPSTTKDAARRVRSSCVA
ncbi:hypothetical protein ACTZWT_17720 [Rhodopseudomonas sp. NSM]